MKSQDTGAMLAIQLNEVIDLDYITNSCSLGITSDDAF